jgi:hypothetical protein
MIRRWLVLATGAVCALAPIAACAFVVGSSGRFEGSGGPSANVTHPAITNCCTVGNLASVAPPTWDGSPTRYTYQWQGGSSSSDPWATIPDASESAYAVQAADVGSQLSAVVTATNSQGPTQATSNEASPASTLVSAAAPVNVEQPQIIGLDTVTVGGNPNTLTAKPGTWSGPQPITYTYGWHFVGSPVMHAGPTLTLDASFLGHALELDVTASNSAGSTKVTGHWFGPVENALPSAPPEYEHIVNPTVPLPTEPAHFLQNGHAIFPGCSIPPASPNTDPAHVWYFDPINGRTQQGMTDAGLWTGAVATGVSRDGRGVVAAADQGHAAHPFKHIQAIFADMTGYKRLFGALAKYPNSVIHPGDTIYIRPGDSTHPLGNLAVNNGYSTSDGTSTGTIAWTWILPDPTASSTPVLTTFSTGAGAAGLVVKGLNFEVRKNAGETGAASSAVVVAGNRANDVHDVATENLSITSWLGHSSDPWLPSNYPNSGGASNGKIDTANPTMSVNVPFTQDPPRLYITAAAGSNKIYANYSTAGGPTTYAPPIGWYIWSPNYYYEGRDIFPATTRLNSGIPNGTKVADIQGRTDLTTRNILTGATAVDVDPVATTVSYNFTTANDLKNTHGTAGQYAVLTPNVTSARTLYEWCVVPTAGVCPNGAGGTASWVVRGYFLPQTGSASTDANIVAKSTGVHMFIWNTSASVWGDDGALYYTIAPCDPHADHATGCPATPPPGCDPKGNASSGCPSTPPAWSGTTRAFDNEPVNLTDWMSISPAGYWNSLDWASVTNDGIAFVGGYVTNTINSQPTDLVGAKCLSAKDNIIRDTYNGVITSNTTNIIIYNNKVKFVTDDDFDVYSDHRNWLIHNYASDPTFMMAHQDGIQFGDSHGRVADDYYSNAAIENEFYSYTDQTNLFPKKIQGINTTENVHWGMYVCCNIVVVTGNAMSITGKYDVVVHNTVMGGIVQGNQPKSGQKNPTYSLIANNIGFGVSRDFSNGNKQVPDFCNTKGDTLAGNLSIPVVIGSAVGLASSAYCTPEHVGIAGARTGVFEGLTAWSTSLDWRSNMPGVSPLFMDYRPFDPPASPPAPGSAIAGNGADFSPCIQNSFPKTGDCAPGSSGIINFRPNPAFVPINPPAIAGSVRAARCLHITRTTDPWYRWCSAKTVNAQSGDVYRTESADGTGGSSPAGTYRFGRGVWTYIGPYNVKTGIIGTGANLGAQAPIANHDGKGWTNPPNIGAY